MADPINLRQERKRRRRAEKEAEAAANRVAHGAPKAETVKTRLANEIEARRLDAHRRTPPGDRGQ